MAYVQIKEIPRDSNQIVVDLTTANGVIAPPIKETLNSVKFPPEIIEPEETTRIVATEYGTYGFNEVFVRHNLTNDFNTFGRAPGNFAPAIYDTSGAVYQELLKLSCTTIPCDILYGSYEITSVPTTITMGIYSVDYETRASSSQRARAIVWLKGVKLNNVAYEWLLVPCSSVSYGAYSYPRGSEYNKAQLTNIYGVNGTSLEAVSFNVGDIITFDTPTPVLDGWFNFFANNTVPLGSHTFIVSIYDALGDNIDTFVRPIISKVQVSVISDNNAQIHMVNSFDTEYDIVVEVAKRGYSFVGFSTKPNAVVANVPIGTISVNWDGSEPITLYPVYTKELIPPTPSDTFSVIFYDNKAQQNVVDKTDYITAYSTINGTLKDSTSIINPTITFALDNVPQANYAYIPSFNRYYFINDIVSVRNKLWEISFSVDVLMTYKEGIYNSLAFVDRNANEFNKMIVDDKVPFEQGQTVTTKFISNDVFLDSTGQFVLTGLLVSTGDSASSTSLELDVGSEVTDEESEDDEHEQSGLVDE